MKTIVVVSNTASSTYNFRFEITQALIDVGYRVVVMAERDSIDADRFEEIGCIFEEAAFARHGTNPFDEMKLIGIYKEKLKKYQPDAVLTYTVKPNLYAGMACGSLGIPFIANITGLGTPLENPGLVQKIIVMLYRISFRKVKTVFFQNTENRQFFIDRKIGLGHHKLLPGSGVNVEKFAPLPFPSDDEIGFSFISRIMAEKGIDQYLDAAVYFRKKYPQTRFHIGGFYEQSYEERIKQLQSKGVIEYHGYVDDTRTILGNVQCNVLPTWYPEGMSNSLLESCACARAIITTDRSGCREIVDDGVNGFVVRPKDSGDLIEKIERFLAMSHEERRQMGKNGRLKVERQFDRRLVVNAYLAELREVFGE